MTPEPQRSVLPTLSHQAAGMFAPLQRELDRVFSDFSRSFSSVDLLGAAPSLDFCETDAGIELTVEVPGLKESDIKVTVEDDMLVVSGEKTGETKEEGKTYRILERRYGSFRRAVKLPAGVDAKAVAATLKDGVLKVTAPRTPGQTPQPIKIEVAAP